jgi:hypothetical protein
MRLVALGIEDRAVARFDLSMQSAFNVQMKGT